MNEVYIIAGVVLVGTVFICSGYMTIKNAFVDAVRSATQSLTAAVDKLSAVVDELREEMRAQRATLHDIELQVQTNTTNIDNQHRRIKVLEGYHKDRGANK